MIGISESIDHWSSFVDCFDELNTLFFVHILKLLLFHSNVVVIDVVNAWKNLVHVAYNSDVHVCFDIVIWICL